MAHAPTAKVETDKTLNLLVISARIDDLALVLLRSFKSVVPAPPQG